MDDSFVEEVMDRLQLTTRVRSRKMFGVVGLFYNDLMFALIADNELYLKADKQSIHFFSDQQLPAFVYTKAEGRDPKMSYYLAPEAFFEDADETILWTHRAIDAALRTPRESKKKSAKKIHYTQTL